MGRHGGEHGGGEGFAGEREFDLEQEERCLQCSWGGNTVF